MQCKAIHFSGHAIRRCAGWGLDVGEVAEIVRNGEVIEDYPTDFAIPELPTARLDARRPCSRCCRERSDNRYLHRGDGVPARSREVVGRLQTKEDTMKCVICKHGETLPGKTTVAVERQGAVVVIKDVPAEICADCGEYYLDQTTAARVAAMGEEAVLHNAEVEVRKYAA